MLWKYNNVMKKQFLYLVRTQSLSKFKIGFTVNPKARAHNYKSHNPLTEYMCHKEIPDKRFEKLVHYELLKMGYKKSIVQGTSEWFDGTLNMKEFNDIITKVIGVPNAIT